MTAHRVFDSALVFTFRACLIQFTELCTAEVYLCKHLNVFYLKTPLNVGLTAVATFLNILRFSTHVTHNALILPKQHLHF